MTMKKVVVIHGYTSSPDRPKYLIIARELKRLGVAYAIPALPGGVHPHSREWLAVIDREVVSSEWPVTLVGHSLGTRAALLYLDQFDRHVAAVVLISPFDNDFVRNRGREEGNFADFFEYALDLEKVRGQADQFLVIHSTDDEAIDYQQGVEISQALGAELVTYNDMGHFSGEERVKENAAAFMKAIRAVL